MRGAAATPEGKQWEWVGQRPACSQIALTTACAAVRRGAKLSCRQQGGSQAAAHRLPAVQVDMLPWRHGSTSEPQAVPQRAWARLLATRNPRCQERQHCLAITVLCLAAARHLQMVMAACSRTTFHHTSCHKTLEYPWPYAVHHGNNPSARQTQPCPAHPNACRISLPSTSASVVNMHSSPGVLC